MLGNLKKKIFVVVLYNKKKYAFMFIFIFCHFKISEVSCKSYNTG